MVHAFAKLYKTKLYLCLFIGQYEGCEDPFSPELVSKPPLKNNWQKIVYLHFYILRLLKLEHCIGVIVSQSAIFKSKQFI